VEKRAEGKERKVNRREKKSRFVRKSSCEWKKVKETRAPKNTTLAGSC